MTKLIIGKNSSLAQKLRSKLSGYHFISHLDIANIDFDLYSEIYVFSYSKNSTEENIYLINSISHKKIFYISTVAVFSLGLSGEHYKYPRIKSEVEKYCHIKGIKIIRIGSFQNAKFFKHTVAATSLEMIVNYFESSNKAAVKNLFYIDHYSIGIADRIYGKIFQTLSYSKYMSLCLAAISKLFKKKLYGYSYAANSCLKAHIQIGYGALGSRIKPDYKTHIIVSNEKNLKITENGFNGLLIGKTKQGLGKLWHGVYTKGIKENNKFIVKNILHRSQLCKSEKNKLNIFPVDFIENDGDFWTLSSKTDQYKLITKRITLAAGPIENLRLLSCLDSINVDLNDDEVLFAGTISINEPGLFEILKIGSLHIKQRYLLHFEMKEGYLLIDFRPFIPDRKNILDQNFYNNSAIQIIYKLITKFNIYRLNEAIYNLLGVGIKTENLSIYCQYSKINSINLRADNGHIISLRKKRASDQELNEIFSLLSNLFQTFNKSVNSTNTVDGQHISGGEEILTKNNIANHLKNSSLKIIGIPTKKFNDALHTTVRLFPNENNG